MSVWIYEKIETKKKNVCVHPWVWRDVAETEGDIANQNLLFNKIRS